MSTWRLAGLDWVTDGQPVTRYAVIADVAGAVQTALSAAAMITLTEDPEADASSECRISCDELVGMNGWPVVTVTFSNREAARAFAVGYFQTVASDEDPDEFIEGVTV